MSLKYLKRFYKRELDTVSCAINILFCIKMLITNMPLVDGSPT